MTQIPSDLDQLMWLLAESDDVAASQEFEKRFPELAPELHRRKIAVKSLRSNKPNIKTPSKAPVFQPRPAPEPRKTPYWAYVLACVLLASFAYGSFYVTSRVMGGKTVPNAQETPGSNSELTPFKGIPPQNPSQPLDSRQIDQELGPGDVQPIQNQVPKYLQPTSIELEQVSLHAAIQTIANQTGMIVEIAPRTPDPMITVRFHYLTGPEMLEQLGKAYGFTPLNQGQNRYLLIPSLQFTEPDLGDSGNNDQTADPSEAE
jgi:hypothetical protein